MGSPDKGPFSTSSTRHTQSAWPQGLEGGAIEALEEFAAAGCVAAHPPRSHPLKIDIEHRLQNKLRPVLGHNRTRVVNVTSPPPVSAVFSAASVQFAALPLPTTPAASAGRAPAANHTAQRTTRANARSRMSRASPPARSRSTPKDDLHTRRAVLPHPALAIAVASGMRWIPSFIQAIGSVFFSVLLTCGFFAPGEDSSHAVAQFL